MWRESFLRRIREVREKEPQREIVYTDETWLNGGHRVKKEWVDLKALENPRRSIKEYGTVGCIKDNVGSVQFSSFISNIYIHKIHVYD